jgi:hypothetical protein
MPPLVGKPFHDAIQALQALGLFWSVWLPALPPTMRPSLLDNYLVAEQNPKPGTCFTQTVIRVLADGSVLTKTSTVGLMTELRPS